MTPSLSEGSLEVIMNGGDIEKPVMQVLDRNKIQASGANERYKLLVSDGKHSHSFGVGPQLNDKLITGELSDYSVVQIDGFDTSPPKNAGKGEKRDMIIVDLTILSPGSAVGKKLGNPQTWTEKSKPSPAPALTAIASLRPFQNRWEVKARVMTKSPIRPWINAKRKGKVFNMDLCDESGEIRAVAFDKECDKFYDMIQVDKVYYISGCYIQKAKKQFSKLKNDYEMTFTSETVVVECMEDASSVPSIKYDFVPINEIGSKTPKSLLDVIGVCKSATDLQDRTERRTGKPLKKREVTLVDSSGGAVVLTLWGTEAENFVGNTNPVVAVKGSRLDEFNGSKSLTCLTMVHLNPDITEAHMLRGWYDNGGAAMEVDNIFAKSGMYAGGGSNEWITISESESQSIDYYLLGVLTIYKSEKSVYKACPLKHKMLEDLDKGMFRCEKCNREYPNYKYRILLKATVSDPTGDREVTAFDEAAESMLGKTAADIGQMIEYDKNAYAAMFEEVKFKTFVFKFRTKMETYNGKDRLETIVKNAAPVDYKDGNARLIKSIKSITGVEV